MANANGGEAASSSPHRRPPPTTNASASASSSSVTFSSTITEHQEKSPSLTSLLGLTAYQQQQLAQSWPRIQRSGGHSSGAEIFRKLTLKYAPIKDTFQKHNIVGRFSRPPGYDIYKEHGKALFDVLVLAVKSLSDTTSDDLIDMCSQYGAKHSGLRSSGFQTRMWDDLSELLVEHIARNEAVRGRRESVRAWTTLIMFIVDKMKDGYDRGLRTTLVTTHAAPQSQQVVMGGDDEFEEAQATQFDSAGHHQQQQARASSGGATLMTADGHHI